MYVLFIVVCALHCNSFIATTRYQSILKFSNIHGTLLFISFLIICSNTEVIVSFSTSCIPIASPTKPLLIGNYGMRTVGIFPNSGL